MNDTLNLIVEIYRKETESSGTIQKPFTHNFVLNEGDEIKLSIMNVEKASSQDKEMEKAWLELCNSTSSPFWPPYEKFKKEFQSLKGKVNQDEN